MRRNKLQVKKAVQDEEIPVRAQVREVSEGMVVTVIMMLVTIFALIGDDFRQWFFPRQYDPIFEGALCFSLVAFAVEIMVNSCVLDDFKWSFFFWLDIVATGSLVLDIPWIVEFVQRILGMRTSAEAVDISMGDSFSNSAKTAKITKIFKSLRLIRLIRIIKLYKYAIKSRNEKEEAKMREQQKASVN